jgi:glycosyltransferase involved in cell wall biosynthesis
MKTIIFPLIGLTPHGGNRVIAQISNGLAEFYNVKLVTPIISNNFSYEIDKKVSIELIESLFKNKILVWVYFVFTFPFKHARRNVDLYVVTHFLTIISGLILKFIFKKKVVFLCQGVEHNAFKGKIASTVARFVSLLGHKFFYVIVVNNTLARDVEKEFLIQADETIELGVDDVFIDTPLTFSERTFDIICFPRSENYKGFEYLYESLGKLTHRYKILCVTQNAQLKKHLNKYKTIVIEKPVNDLDLVRLIDKSKLCLYTSTYEGFGLPPLECMARGVPTVMFECTGNQNYTNVHNSIVIDKLDVDELVSRAELLLGDLSLLNAYSKSASETGKNRSFSKQVKKFVTVVNNYLMES